MLVLLARAAVLADVGVVRDVTEHMGTHFRWVLGEIFAWHPPTEKRRRARWKLTVLFQQVL
jgi:hypothetical protein